MSTPRAKNLGNAFRKDLTSPGKLEGAGESQGILQEHPHSQNVFGFLELVLHQGEFRAEFEERFCFQSQDGENHESSERGPPSTKGSWCSSFLLESSQPYWADFLRDFLPEEAAGVERESSPDQFITRSREPSPSSFCSSLPSCLDTFPGAPWKSQIPRQEKRLQKDLEVPPFVCPPKGTRSKVEELERHP